MNTSEVFLYELASTLERVGGAKGLGLLAVLAALTVILPWRFGAGLLDPLLLLVYAALAPLLAGNFAAQAFAAEKARAHIIHDGDPAVALALGKVLAATLWGFVCWVILMAVPFTALNAARRTLLLPPVLDLLALALFAAALAWVVSALGSIFASGVATPSSAQGLVRGMVLIPLLLFAAALSVLPQALRAPLADSIGPGHLPITLGLASLALIAIGWPAVRKTAARIEELRHPLSILES